MIPIKTVEIFTEDGSSQVNEEIEQCFDKMPGFQGVLETNYSQKVDVSCCSFVKDTRRCVICNKTEKEVQDRLIPVERMKWVHSNCLLFGDYTQFNSSPQNEPIGLHGIYQSLSIKTLGAECGFPHAVVKCSYPQCPLSLHPPCAFVDRNRKFFCHNHAGSDCQKFTPVKINCPLVVSERKLNVSVCFSLYFCYNVKCVLFSFYLNSCASYFLFGVVI